MYLITKQKGGHQAIPIKDGDKWDFSKLTIGRHEVRIIFRLCGRRYLLYSTRALASKYPEIGIAQFTPLCDEIIDAASECISNQEQYIDFDRIASGAECRHHQQWRNLGLIVPTTTERYFGHPIDPKAEQLVSYVKIDLEDILVIDHEPPIDDCGQEALPY